MFHDSFQPEATCFIFKKSIRNSQFKQEWQNGKIPDQDVKMTGRLRMYVFSDVDLIRREVEDLGQGYFCSVGCYVLVEPLKKLPVQNVLKL